MDFVGKYSKEVVIGALILSNIFVWAAVLERSNEGVLSVYFLDVGQGDAIFVETPDKRQMLIDGGKNRQVISELGKVMPFGDKSIDVVIATHPDADHIGGLPEVVSRFDIGMFIETGVESDNTIDDELGRRVGEKNIGSILAKRGMVINFGDGAKLKILFPNQDVSRWETNDASIVARLEYGEKSFLLTGDSPIKVENILLNLDKDILGVDVLKAGHHGSRTSTSLAFAKAVSPEYAVISAGRDNSYGHPHQEVIKILQTLGSQIKNTAELGTIVFETDGKTVEIK